VVDGRESRGPRDRYRSLAAKPPRCAGTFDLVAVHGRSNAGWSTMRGIHRPRPSSTGVPSMGSPVTTSSRESRTRTPTASASTPSVPRRSSTAIPSSRSLSCRRRCASGCGSTTTNGPPQPRPSAAPHLSAEAIVSGGVSLGYVYLTGELTGQGPDSVRRLHQGESFSVTMSEDVATGRIPPAAILVDPLAASP
jgi:hypothetical protein